MDEGNALRIAKEGCYEPQTQMGISIASPSGESVFEAEVRVSLPIGEGPARAIHCAFQSRHRLRSDPGWRFVSKANVFCGE